MYYNKSHLPDPTAGQAMKETAKEEKEINELVRILHYIANKAGYIIKRLQLIKKAEDTK